MTDFTRADGWAEDMVSPEDDFPRLQDTDFEDASLDPFAGGTANNKPIWTPEEAAAYLNRTGGGWGEGGNRLLQEGQDASVITFGFHENQQSLIDNGYIYTRPNSSGGTTLYAFSEYFNFAAFTEAQREATREAIEYWDDLVAVTFVETHADDGDINFGNLASAPNTQAYSRIPTAGYADNFGGYYGTYSIAGLAGDVWVSASQNSNFQLDEGLYGMNTLVHEIGHSLGLSHPGAYNFGPGFAVNYTNGAEYAQDARNYSIMSYWNPRDMGSTATGVPTRDYNWSLMAIAYGATPMVHDILAVQNMYGADPNTRTDDTTYGFNSTAGRDAFDFEATPWPTMAIYDAGGIDTLDASGYEVEQYIDLTPGMLSSIGGITYEDAIATLTYEQVNANRAAAGYGPISESIYNSNMAAFATRPDWYGRLTDNVGIAYGTVIENAKGGSGKDTIIGNTADNVLEGNNGDDLLFGNDGDDNLVGGHGADVLDGGADVDRLEGGSGDDLLTGGADADEFVFGRRGGADVITDFEDGVDVLTFNGVSISRTRVFDADGDGDDDTVLTLSNGGGTVTLLDVTDYGVSSLALQASFDSFGVSKLNDSDFLFA